MPDVKEESIRPLRNEPSQDKTRLQGFQSGPTQTRLYSHRRWLEALNDCTIYVAKTKALISCAVTVQLICAFVFAYAKSRFSHYVAQIDQGVQSIWFSWSIFLLIILMSQFHLIDLMLLYVT